MQLAEGKAEGKVPGTNGTGITQGKLVAVYFSAH